MKKFKRFLMIFLAYSPVFIVGGQVVVNILSFVWPEGYRAAGYYLNAAFGTNLFFPFVLLALTILFRFCRVSFWAAVAECCFGVLWFIRPNDDIYNISFQVIVGTLALIGTFTHFITKFPMCRIALPVYFFKGIWKTKSCRKAFDHYEEIMTERISKKLNEQRHH